MQTEPHFSYRIRNIWGWEPGICVFASFPKGFWYTLVKSQCSRSGSAGKIPFWEKLEVKTDAKRPIWSHSHSCPFCQRKLSGFGMRSFRLQHPEGYSKVIAQGQQLSTLILQIIDEPRVLSILLSEHFLQGSHRKYHSSKEDFRT